MQSLFHNKQVLMHSEGAEGANPDTIVSIGIREGRVYKLQDQPVRGFK
jgi:hypothetical protein